MFENYVLKLAHPISNTFITKPENENEKYIKQRIIFQTKKSEIFVLLLQDLSCLGKVAFTLMRLRIKLARFVVYVIFFVS